MEMLPYISKKETISASWAWGFLTCRLSASVCQLQDYKLLCVGVSHFQTYHWIHIHNLETLMVGLLNYVLDLSSVLVVQYIWNLQLKLKRQNKQTKRKKKQNNPQL